MQKMFSFFYCVLLLLVCINDLVLVNPLLLVNFISTSVIFLNRLGSVSSLFSSFYDLAAPPSSLSRLIHSLSLSALAHCPAWHLAWTMGCLAPDSICVSTDMYITSMFTLTNVYLQTNAFTRAVFSALIQNAFSDYYLHIANVIFTPLINVCVYMLTVCAPVRAAAHEGLCTFPSK